MILWRKPDARRNPAPAAAKRVLIIKLDGLAEFTQALAAAKMIRDYHMGARITLLTTPEFKDLAEKCPYFDTVDPEGKPREPQATAQLITRIRAAKYDMIYDLESSSRTNAYFQGLRPWPPNWSGGAPGASHQIADADSLNPLDRLGLQMRAAGMDVTEAPLPDLSWVRAALRDPPRLQPDYFGIRGRYVLLLPRGSDVAPARRWAPEKYVQLANRIAANGVTPVVLGGQEEREIGAAIAAGEKRTKNLVTRPDIFQCAALAERAAFAVGDDVDLLHVAAAAGAPCLVLLSARDDVERMAPRGRGGVVALTAAVVADLPVDQVDRQLKNCGVYSHAATA
jgi:ADP-heptose:LPS heptosyltransferase